MLRSTPIPRFYGRAVVALGLPTGPELQRFFCLSSCYISIQGDHVPPGAKNSGGLPLATVPHPPSCTSSVDIPDHTDPISSPSSGPSPPLSRVSCGTCSLVQAALWPALPFSPSSGGRRDCRGPACCLDNTRRASTLRQQPLCSQVKVVLSPQCTALPKSPH